MCKIPRNSASSLVRFSLLFFRFDNVVLTSSANVLGSTDPDGLLTFKFDTSASGWKNMVYMEIVQKLVDSLASKDGKSILECVSDPTTHLSS